MAKASAAEVSLRIRSLVEYFVNRGNESTLQDVFSAVYQCRDTQDRAVLRKFARDVETLREVYREQNATITYDRRARKYRFTNDAGYLLHLKLTGKDVQALVAGMKLSEHFLPIFDRSAQRIWTQLKASIPEDLRIKGDMFAEATTVAFPVSKTDESIFQKVVDAIFERKVLKVTQYRTYDGEEKSFHISPWFVYFKHHSWYLWGKATEYDSSGPFRINRMRVVQPAPDSKRYEAPPYEAGMNDFIHRDSVPGQPPPHYTVRLRIHPPFASPAMDTEWFPGQRIRWEDPLKKDSAIFEMEAQGLEDVTRWIMRALDSFEILEPSELKEKVAEKIEQYRKRNPLCVK